MSSRLTRCEMEVMNIVWQKGRVTVQDVCDGLNPELAYSTVMTTLRILETQRKADCRIKEGRAYVYEAAITREAASVSLLSDLREHLFRGSTASLVMNLLGDGSVTKQDVRELKAALAQLERGI